jgi:hypothetical protein
MTDKKTKIEFAPGCFDHLEFESQEELDALVKQIQDMFDSGEAQVRAVPIDELIEHMSDEDIEQLLEDLGVDIDESDIGDVTDISPQENNGNRTLH